MPTSLIMQENRLRAVWNLRISDWSYHYTSLTFEACAQASHKHSARDPSWPTVVQVTGYGIFRSVRIYLSYIH